jgi:hypothetical protein
MLARLRNGSTAEVVDGEIVVKDPRGRTVIVFDGARARVEAEDLDFNARKITLSAGVIELRAARIFERAGEVYRDVEGTLHTRAERVRTLVKDAYHLFAKRASVASEEDTSIDGRRVLLG